MALKQPNSAAVWTEPKGSGAASTMTPYYFVANAFGGYTLQSTGTIGALLLANGVGGFTRNSSPANPSSLAQRRLAQTGSTIISY